MMASLGKYQLLRELNSGSMGTVYIARDNVLDRDVALKTVLPGASMDAELKERFYREARACARLQHPSIVTIYDFGEENGTAYIAMELLAGTDARKIIQERRPLPLAVKLDAAAMVCEGLGVAHAAGIVHRDIKPSNIFIMEDGRAKILDFGIARTAASNLTLAGRVLGTPNYMAPEQILGKTCDGRSDLFSTAIVLFELIASAHPFQGASIPKRIVRETADSLSSAWPEAPPKLVALLAKALQKEPERRYQTAADMARDLRAAAAHARRGQEEPTLTHAMASDSGIRAAVAPPSEPVRPPQPPQEGEGTEVVMSRVLTALQDFDSAVEENDVAKARKAFQAVKQAAARDDRFEGAVQSTQERLHELEVTAPPPPPEPVREAPVVAAKSPEPPPRPAEAETVPLFKPPETRPAPPAPPPPTPPAPMKSGDATALFSGSFGHAGESSTPSVEAPWHEAKPAAKVPAVPPPAPAAAPKPAPAPAAKSATPAPVANPGARKSMLLFVGVAAGVIILAAVAYFTFVGGRANGTPMPAVGSAQVTASRTDVLASPVAGSTVVVTAKQGAALHLLRVPRSASQDWTEVQYTKGRNVFPPGFARTSDLGKWTSDKAGPALELIKAFGPGAAASETDIETQLDRLKSFATRFSGSPEEPAAHLEIARWNVALAKLATGQGRPAADYIQEAQTQLAQAGNNPALAPDAGTIRQDLDAMNQPAANPAPATGHAKAEAPAASGGPAPALSPEALFGRAKTAWQNGNYDRAETYLNLALREKRDYPEAQDLLGKVRKAKAIFGN